MQDTRSEVAIPVPPPTGRRGRHSEGRYPTVPRSNPPFYDPNGLGSTTSAGISSDVGSRPRAMKDPVRSSRSQTPRVQMPVPGVPAIATAAPEYRQKERLKVKDHPEYEIVINRGSAPRQQQQQSQPFPHFVNQGTGSMPLSNPGFIDPMIIQGQQPVSREHHHHSHHHHHHREHRTHHRSRTSSQSQAQPPPTAYIQATNERPRTYSHGQEHSRARTHSHTHSRSHSQQPAQYEQPRKHESRSHSREHHQRPRTSSSSRYIDHAAHAQHSPLPSPALLPEQRVQEPPPQYMPPAEPQRMRRQTLPGGQVLDQTYQYSNCTGRRRALFVGINYKDQPNELQGCVNDVKNMCKFLMNKYAYKAEDIVILTDDAEHARQQPTKKNIMDAMRWLVRGARTHDSLFFHYSGHGGQTRDLDGDEIDGYDEVIFPVDYLSAGHIVDDDMNRILVRRLPRGCRLTAVFDSCHSGTALDLDYTYHSNGRLRGHQVTASARASKATEGDVISFCACRDDQISADTTEQGIAVGAMSYAFMLSLHQMPSQSYRGLLKSIRDILSKKYSQKCQLSSSHPINTNLAFIM